MAAQVDDLEEVNEDFLYAARCGEKDEMLAALGAGADINARGSGGNTALHMACANGHLACVRALLDRGADCTAQNEARNTPAHYAAQMKQTACLKALARRQETDFLARNEFGKSVLTEAIASADVAMCQAALEHPSAAEEKIIAGVAEEAGDEAASATHDLDFGEGVCFAARELAMQQQQQQQRPSLEGAMEGVALEGAGDRTGLGIWASSLVLARWVVQERAAFLDSAVLELGAGCGVAGIALSLAQPTACVVLSDAHAATLENLRFNAAAARTRPRVASLDWAQPPADQAPYDHLIGADLVYTEQAAEVLASAVARLLPPSGKPGRSFWYAAPAGDRAGDAAFLAKLAARGFTHTALDAPAALYANPLKSRDEDAALAYFSDLATAKFTLHRFCRRPVQQVEPGGGPPPDS